MLAARRAVETENPNPLVVDPIARHFADEALLAQARAEANQEHYVLYRHRAIEDFAMKEPLAQQVVLLGAGFDTKFVRYAQLRESRFIEVDDPAMLALKAEILTAHGLPVAPSESLRVSDDASLETLLQKLDPGLSTTWIAEGYIMYQNEAFVHSLLNHLFSYFESSLRVAFDIFTPSLKDDSEFQRIRRIVEAHGEVFRSYVDPAEIRERLGGSDVCTSVESAELLYDRYRGGVWRGMRGLAVVTTTRS